MCLCKLFSLQQYTCSTLIGEVRNQEWNRIEWNWFGTNFSMQWRHYCVAWFQLWSVILWPWTLHQAERDEQEIIVQYIYIYVLINLYIHECAANNFASYSYHTHWTRHHNYPVRACPAITGTSSFASFRVVITWRSPIELFLLLTILGTQKGTCID